MPIDGPRIEAAVTELLSAIGEDPARPGLAGTPRYVAQSYAEIFAGVGGDPIAPLRDTVALEAQQTGELVLLRDIAFRSICEHHLLPFSGVAHLAYLPVDRAVGLGRLVQSLEVLAARPQLQERLGDELADAIDAALAPRGVLVVLDARHECVAARGPRQSGSSTVTVAARGELAEPASQAGVLAVIGGGTE
ncbi:GTP cyclohydrolase I [uncultured Schumannella sp.]|uniref:GTP cyclohydrolase I n=1 Tax=uncultured Schumannella sp. TaxID=1195956 RepID=UPI0025EEB14A|nr:GTP cyclohydrolase I [uncultured Schumannella sp.]